MGYIACLICQRRCALRSNGGGILAIVRKFICTKGMDTSRVDSELKGTLKKTPGGPHKREEHER